MRKNFIIDTLLNIIATAIPLLILQLISLPIVGAKYSDEQYGLVITLISLYTLLSLPFGNVLNNVRLLMDREYQEKNLSGDFNILLLASLAISSLLIVIFTIYYEGLINLTNIILIILVSCLNLIREYIIVSFRLKLNYRGILINNIILTIGYIMGTLIFYISSYWQFIYIIGSGLSLVYIIQKSTLLKEDFKKTRLFKKTTAKSAVLFGSSFLKTILTYADKLLIFPLLGPAAVSVYYTATILGKIASMVINPINGVILSYLTKMNRLSTNKFVSILIIASLIGIIGYFVTIIISEPLLYLLYPKWAEDSLELIYVTTASAIIGVLSSVIHPFLLRFNNINWQLFISGINVVVYIISAFVFYKFFGLMGFCIGILISNILKLLLMVIIFITINKRNEEIVV